MVIIGARDDPRTQALLDALYGAAQPNKVVQVIAPGEALPPNHPAQGKEAVEGQATAYVCVGTTCSLPVTGAEALLQALPAPHEHDG